MTGEERYIPRSLKEKPEYTLYRNTINKEFKIQGRDKYFKVVKEFFDIIAEETLERKGGVYIKGLGYFFNWLCPRKMVWNPFGVSKDIYSTETDNRQYFPTYVPVRTRSEWTMDKTFSSAYKQKLKENIQAGKRYKSFHYSLKKTKWI